MRTDIIRRRGMMGGGDSYTEIKYIILNGHQYIDTAYFPSNRTKLTSAFVFKNPASINVAFSSDYDFAVQGFGIVQYNQYVNVEWGNSYHSAKNGDNAFYVDFDKNDCRVYDGTQSVLILSRVFGSQVFTCANSLLLGAQHRNGVIQNYMSGQLFITKIWDDNIPLMDMRPHLRQRDNKPGLLDMVSNTFFVNQGTGDFGYETMDGIIVNPI